MRRNGLLTPLTNIPVGEAHSDSISASLDVVIRFGLA